MAGVLGPRDDPRGMEPHIRAAAKKYGVDEDTALRVAKSEGLGTFLGDHGKSGGAFQLYTGGGVGNAFQKETGLNPLDPANEPATIDYAMKTAAQGGWKPWYGAQKIGVTGMMGINGQPGAQQGDQMAAATTPPKAGAPAAGAAAPLNTLSMNSPLAGTASTPQGAPPLHSNQAVSEALSRAFQPIVPDQINSLLGPAIGNIQGHVNPIAYYQPRQAAPIAPIGGKVS